MTDTPVLVPLDPHAADRDAERTRLVAAGPVARVELPGGVRMWAVTHQDAARRLLTDARFVKDVNRWGAWQRGEIPEGWSLTAAVNPGRSVVTVDGADHRRLRSLTAAALTPGRVDALRPRITEVTDELLDHLAGHGTEVVDLKSAFAFPLPMNVIGELCGLDRADTGDLRRLYDSLFSSVAGPAEVMATIAALRAFYTRVLDDKRAHPGDDLASALLAAGEGGERFTDEEVQGTLSVMVAAGHETTVNLIVNAVRALCGHRDQLDLLLTGRADWTAAVEETLRWASPVNNFLARYATEDIDLAGTLVEEGEAVLVAYGALGHDPAEHGPDADRFDVTRPATRNLAFGHGPHICPGSHLARLEAAIALPALFERYPELHLAVPDAELAPSPAIALNSLQALPVRLHRQHGPESGA
ncbi:cytochrome P450 [Kitasatospora sp. NPDC049285]|uniref:cytochrome P450 family protein n=1 Tax=Kitasatospora sp. NPDC049285 TaxID=3157096 RepID=UPI00341428BB